LTKVDVVVAGEEEDTWLKIAKNEARPLRHGYYVTRLAPPEELRAGLSWNVLREKEKEFFLSRRRWSGGTKIRCGTERLTEALSELLSRMIAEEYP
jgi:hypothetical protein